jgi:membrane protein YqaA with SNARE-associated domain
MEGHMSDVVAAATVAAVASMFGSVLTFVVGIRSLRRSVSTSNGEPLGRVMETRLDRIERRLDGLDRSVGEAREWLAFPRGATMRSIT